MIIHETLHLPEADEEYDWTLFEQRSPEDVGCEGCGERPPTWKCQIMNHDGYAEEYCGTCVSSFFRQWIYFPSERSSRDWKVEYAASED